MTAARTGRKPCPLGGLPAGYAVQPGDDVTEAIFLRAMLAIRDTVPSLAHHPLHELDVLFGDLANEIAEIVDASGSDSTVPKRPMPRHRRHRWV